MELHQIQVSYLADDDRLLCRTSFQSEEGDLQEIRAWITRRLLANLWIGLIGVLETQVGLDKPDASHASAEIVGMEHEAVIEEMKDNGGFSQPYQDGIESFPLGEEPVLTKAIQFTLNPHQPVRMNFITAQEKGFELLLPPALLHSFCLMLQEGERLAGWGLDLKLPAPTEAPARLLN